MRVTRREFAKIGIRAGGLLLAGFDKLTLSAASISDMQNGFAGGQRLGMVEFLHEGRAGMGTVLGEELDGRLYTDIAKLTVESTTIPTEQFYIRTRASKLLPNPKSWQVRVEGLDEKTRTLTNEDLRKTGKPMGLHLMECAGNVGLAGFGMISVASWAGMPLAETLENAKAKPASGRVLISGFDQYAGKSVTSVPGASWIFSLDELRKAQAFLAVEMNDAPLTPDHGAPVRLVVPGWYGCSCIKWVNRIALVKDAAEATSQMQEYAGRTHQRGVPELARDFQPAMIDPAAMPIRIEKWLVGGKIKYQVVGIAWGGTAFVQNLTIRFNPEEEYVPVDHFAPKRENPWNFWTHAWSPKGPGIYSIRLAVKDAGVRTRRLDSGYYVRTVEIQEV